MKINLLQKRGLSRIFRAPFLAGTASILMGMGAQAREAESSTNSSLSVVGTNASPVAVAEPISTGAVAVGTNRFEVEYLMAVAAQQAEDIAAKSAESASLRATVGDLQIQLEELRIALRKMVGDNAELKLQIEEKERTVQLLTQNLAVWKTEAELFQKKWEEAQLAARASGVKLLSEGEQRLQKQLAESVRELYEAQQQRDRLRREMAVLLETTDQLLRSGDGIDPKRRKQAEEQHDRAWVALQAVRVETDARATNQVVDTTATVQDCRVIEINRELQLVVLNVGRVHGVRVGMPFTVLHDDVVVAHVKTVDVREKISGALIERAEKSAPIRAGDRVKVSTAR